MFFLVLTLFQMFVARMRANAVRYASNHRGRTLTGLLMFCMIAYLRQSGVRRLHIIDRYRLASEKTLERYGRFNVAGIHLLKEPASHWKKRGLDIATFYGFSTQLARYRRDHGHDIWPQHATIICELETTVGTALVHIEKNNTVCVTDRVWIAPDTLSKRITVTQTISLRKLLSTTHETMGAESYFNWDMKGNNCQHFVLAMLRALEQRDCPDDRATGFVHQTFFSDEMVVSPMGLFIVKSCLQLWNVTSSIVDDAQRCIAKGLTPLANSDLDECWYAFVLHCVPCSGV